MFGIPLSIGLYIPDPEVCTQINDFYGIYDVVNKPHAYLVGKATEYDITTVFYRICIKFLQLEISTSPEESENFGYVFAIDSHG